MALNKEKGSQYFGIDSTLLSDATIEARLEKLVNILVGALFKRFAAGEKVADAFDIDWTGYKINGQAITSAGEVIQGINDALAGGAASANTVYTKGNGVTVTDVPADEEKGTVRTVTVAANLKLKYVDAVAATEEAAAVPAYIDLVDATDETKSFGTVSISDIIGNALLSDSNYNEATNNLTLTFNQADGSTKDVNVDLSKLIDINDILIANDSEDYIGIIPMKNADEEVTGLAQLSVNIVNLADATDSNTGLVDAMDAKDYVDLAVADKNVDAEGDDYVSASAADNKVTVSTNVVNVADATESNTGLVDAYDVKDYVDTAVANKNVDAEGDDYVSATAADNKVTVAANVVKMSELPKGVGDEVVVAANGDNITYKIESIEEGDTLTYVLTTDAVGEGVVSPIKYDGENIVDGEGSPVDGASLVDTLPSEVKPALADAADVKSYVDEAIAAANSSADEAIKALDADLEETGTYVTVGVTLADGKLTAVSVEETYAAAKETSEEDATFEVTDGLVAGSLLNEAVTYILTLLNSQVKGLDADVTSSDTEGSDATVVVEVKEADGVLTEVKTTVSKATTSFDEETEALSVDDEDALLTGAAIADIKSFVEAVAEANLESITVAEGSTDFLTVDADDDHLLTVHTSTLGEVGLTQGDDGKWAAGTANTAKGLATAADVATELVNDEEVIAAALNDLDSRLHELDSAVLCSPVNNIEYDDVTSIINA